MKWWRFASVSGQELRQSSIVDQFLAEGPSSIACGSSRALHSQDRSRILARAWRGDWAAKLASPPRIEQAQLDSTRHGSLTNSRSHRLSIVRDWHFNGSHEIQTPKRCPADESRQAKCTCRCDFRGTVETRRLIFSAPAGSNQRPMAQELGDRPEASPLPHSGGRVCVTPCVTDVPDAAETSHRGSRIRSGNHRSTGHLFVDSQSKLVPVWYPPRSLNRGFRDRKVVSVQSPRLHIASR